MSKLKDKYDNPSPYTGFIKKRRTNTSIVKELLRIYLSFDGMPLTEETIKYVKFVMTTLSHYVTLINFTNDGQLGIVDIEGTINYLRLCLMNSQ